MEEKKINHELGEEFYEDSDVYCYTINLNYEWFGCISVKEYKMKSIWSSLQSVSATK